MLCSCRVTRSSINAITAAKYNAFSIKKFFVVGQNRSPNYLRRMLWTPNHQRPVWIKPILRPARYKENEQSLPTKSVVMANFVYSRQFSSKNENLNDSSSKESREQMEGEKTKIAVINDEKDSGKMNVPFIYKYSKIGFTIGKSKVIGSVALFPGGILSWKVLSHLQITPESLTVFALLEPKPEILILGVGEKVVQIPQSVWEFAKSNEIALEVMDTPNACATYNFLTEEGRRTAAALIPPQNIKM